MALFKEQINKAYNIILKRARDYNPIYYGELYEMIGLNHNNDLDRKRGGEILGEVNNKSGSSFLLSSFVVSRGGNGPHGGYYNLAESLGRISRNLSEDEKQEFWIKEMKRVRDKYK